MSITKQGRKSIIIAMVMALLSVCFVPSMVKADTIIDTSKTGSITINKYAGDEIQGLGDYPTQAEAQAAVDAALLAGDIEPQAGVVFNYIKVGDVAQYTKDEGTNANVTKIGYSVNAATVTFLGLTATDIDITISGVDYYTTTTLQTALAAKTQAEVENFIGSGAASMPATDAAGKSSVSGLSLGLYLFVEYYMPVNTVSVTAPFFVSVPMTDKATDGSYSWIYDVNVFPKNKVQTIDIDKNIIDEDKNEIKEYDAEIGESVTFLVRADVPLQIGKLEKYIISDTLSVGLTYDAGSYVAQGVKADGSRVGLTNGVDFNFTQAGQTLTWDFVPEELADNQGLSLYDSIEITYTAKLNKDAVVGQPGNPNDIELEYSKETNITEAEGGTTIKTSPVELPKIFTYAIDLLKYGDSDTSNPLKDVEFELQNKDGNKINVSEQVAGVDGAYYIDAAGTATIKSDAAGKIYIKGLETGKYFLEETVTNQGYNLLAEKIEVIITSNEGTYNVSATGTFAPIAAATKYFKDAACEDEFIIPAGLPVGTYVNFGRNAVYTAPGVRLAPMYEQETLEWEANYAMGATNGEVAIKVNNTRGFKIPKTGDTTAMLLYGLGALLATSAIIGAVFTKKRAKR